MTHDQRGRLLIFVILVLSPMVVAMKEWKRSQYVSTKSILPIPDFISQGMGSQTLDELCKKWNLQLSPNIRDTCTVGIDGAERLSNGVPVVNGWILMDIMQKIDVQGRPFAWQTHLHQLRRTVPAIDALESFINKYGVEGLQTCTEDPMGCNCVGKSHQVCHIYLDGLGVPTGYRDYYRISYDVLYRGHLLSMTIFAGMSFDLDTMTLEITDWTDHFNREDQDRNKLLQGL